jgi:hypothetical protein
MSGEHDTNEQQPDRREKTSPPSVTELIKEGLAMRKQVEARYASMQALTEDDLKSRSK